MAIPKLSLLSVLKVGLSDAFISNVTSFSRLDFSDGHWLTFPSFGQLTSRVIILSTCQVTILRHLGVLCTTSDKIQNERPLESFRSLFHLEVLLLVCLSHFWMNSLSGSGRVLGDGVPHHELAQYLVITKLLSFLLAFVIKLNEKLDKAKKKRVSQL